MHQLTRFSDLIVRFGFTGIGHFQSPFNTGTSTSDPTLKFYFDALPPNGMFRDSLLHGFIQSKESILAAEVLKQGASINLEEGLVACQRFFDSGYHKLEINDKRKRFDTTFYATVFKDANNHQHKKNYPNVPIGVHTIEINEKIHRSG